MISLIKENINLFYLGIFILFFLAFCFMIAYFIYSDKKYIKGSKKKEKPKSKEKVKVVKVEHKAEKKIKAKDEDTKQLKAKLFKKVKLYDPTSWISLKLWKNWWLDRFTLHKTILIHMELANGNWRTFLVKPEKNSFRYNKNSYILDPSPDRRGYNMDVKHYQYWYHEHFALPLKFKIPINTLKKKFDEGEAKQVRLSVNPEVLEKFIESDVAQGVLAGSELQAFFKRVQVLIFVLLIVTVFVLLIVLWQSGLLDQFTSAVSRK